MKYVLFEVGNEKYALPIDKIQSIEVIPEIRPIPKAPANVIGVANLRGVITSVLDMRLILDAPLAKFTIATRILVTDNGAYIVDSANDVVEIADAQLEPWDGHERVRGVWSWNGDLILVLDGIESSDAEEATV